METKEEKIFRLFGLEIPRRTAIILLIFVLVSMVVVGIQIYNRQFAVQGEGPVILMYHHIAPAGTYAGTGDADNNAIIDVDKFEEQMKWLYDNGYNTLLASEVMEYYTSGEPFPEKSVVITFDDGYESNYVYAYPLLQKYGLKANISIIVKPTEDRELNPDDSPYEPKSLRHLTFAQLREMMDSGLVEVGSHSYDSHGKVVTKADGSEEPALVSLAYDSESGEMETVEQYIERIREDIQHSVDVMTQYLGEAPAFFAYPYGRYTQELIDVVKDCGFPMAFTVKNGRLDFSVWDVYLLPRYNVDNFFDLEKYEKLLSY